MVKCSSELIKYLHTSKAPKYLIMSGIKETALQFKHGETKGQGEVLVTQQWSED